MKLIDKDTLIAEIERRINGINLDTIEDWRYRLQWEHDIEVMKNILSLINTLGVKETDYKWDAEKKELIKIEQNPAWSEEDEDTLNTIVSHIRNDGRYSSSNLANEYADFVLSLKPNHWKPSEEEIEALEYAAAYVDSKEDKEVYRTIKSLLDELKTLRNNK